MRMLCAILESTSGEVFLDGREIVSMGAEYRDILGYLPQDFGYYPNYTAREFLLYMAALKGIPRDRAKKRAEELLEVAGLSEVAAKKIKTFSGGMKQRVLLAQALLGDPKVVILDEPTAGLDPKERIRIRNFISSLSRGRIILLATHIVSDIESISDQILMMKKGRMVGMNTPGNLVESVADKVKELPCPPQILDRMQEQYKVGNVFQRRGETWVRGRW